MTCDKIRSKLNEYLDGRLRDAEEVVRHVSECAECARELAELRRVRSAVASLPTEGAPEGFRERVMARVTEEASRAGLWATLRTAWWGKPGLVAAAAAAAMVVAYLALPRSSTPTLQPDAALAAIEELHTQVQLAYVLPADSPTALRAENGGTRQADDLDFLYDLEGM
jgi:anti-sigma factor (TIGR02949 family)